MKKVITICAFLMLITSIFATTFIVDGIAYSTYSANTVAVTSNSPIYTGSITIPSTVIYSTVTYNVTTIENQAFLYCSGLTSVSIPSSVTSIGNYAFNGCTGLTSITIPSSVTLIGSFAFMGCIGLTSITIPSSVTWIGNSVFQSCSGLTSITIPSSVTSIGTSVFQSCSGLTSITIPSSVTSIGNNAFQGCRGLTSITIPSFVTSIGNYAFTSCSGLTSVTIPSSVTSIGTSAFYGCSKLTSITIPSSVTLIQNDVFHDCSGLTSITIPNSVTSIGTSAFQNCTGLTSITIPSSVTSIGSNAFSGCTSLTSFTIPSSVVSIGTQAFSGCSGLTSVTIPSSVTSIVDYEFYGCSGLTSITIPSSVTSIGQYAFYNCTHLTTLTCLSSTPPTLGTGCFDNITTITAVFVPGDAAVTTYRANSAWITAFPGTIIKKMPPIFSLEGGNWSESAIWSGGVVPTTGQAVVIEQNISLDVNASVSDLTIYSGSALNVNAGIQLTVSTTFTNYGGTLNLLSDATGTATILTPATLSGTGSYSVQQFLNGKTGTSTRANWYLSSPVSGATAAVFDVASLTNKMTSYNEVTTSYLTQFISNSTALIPGVGYVTYIGGGDATYTFTGGSLNNGDITLTPTRTGTDAGKRGFNLVGNPYPSYLNWASTDIVKTNVRSTIWYRTYSGTEMIFLTNDGTFGTGTSSAYIPPMQAFWIRVNADGDVASLVFKNLARAHQDQSIATNRLRAPKVNSAQIVRLKVSNGINGDEALIVADPNALDGFDNYDSQKMSNANVNIPEIFTLAGSEELVINHLNAINADKELTLGFRPGKTGDFTIEATEVRNLDSNLKVMLLDKLTNTQQEIKVGSPYSFSSDATATNNRFSVLFKAPSAITGLDNPSSNGDMTVYRNLNNRITVICNANVNEKSLVSVYNAVGQQLIQQKPTGKVTEINNTFMPGIYIVSVNNGGQSVTKRIIIN